MFYKRGRLFFRTAVLYGVIVFVVAGCLTGAMTAQRIEREEHAWQLENSRIAGDMMQRMDWKMGELSNLAENMLSNSWVKYTMSDSDVFGDTISAFEQIQINQTLATYKGIFRIADSVAVLFPNRGIAVSDNTWCAMDTYLHSINVTDESGIYEEICQLDKYGVMIKCIGAQAENEKPDGLLLVKRIDQTNIARAVVAMYIEEVGLIKYVAQSALQSLVQFQIICGDETAYTLRGQAENGNFEWTETSQSVPCTYRVTLNRERPSHTAYLSGLMLALLGVLGLSVLLGLAMAAISYRPLEKLLGKIDVRVREKELEYDAIARSYQQLNQEKRDLARANLQYLDIARNSMLIHILWGCFDETEIDEMLGSYSIALEQDGEYCVMILNYFADAGLDENMAGFMALKQTLENHGLQSEMVENMDHSCIAIIAADGRGADVEAAARDMRDYLRMHEETAECLLCSEPVKGLLGISVAYHSLRRDYSRRQLMQSDNEAASAFFPTNWEMQLHQSLREGNAPVVRKILAALQEENKGDESERAIRASVAKRLQGMLEETRMDPAQYAIAQTPDWQTLYQLAAAVCICRSKQEERVVSDEARQIRDYIDSHLCEYSLTQQVVADRLNMTQPSVSKAFKRAFNMNFLDYLQMRRMELAQKRFDEGADQIAQVALSVGYENELTFKRVFKRYMSVSPTDYVQSRKVQKETKAE